MPTLRLHDDDGNTYEVDVPDEDEGTEDEEDQEDPEDRKDREWIRARRKEWENSQSSQKPKVRRVKSSGQKAPPQKKSTSQGRRVLRIA